MAKNKLGFDASESVEGIIYQFYVALERCFNLKENESLYVEREGDVSTDTEQVEVKRYSDALTDSHINFWNTLNNWLNPSFNSKKYKFLVLLTTQDYGERSGFKYWNTQDENGRLEILKAIKQSALSRFNKRQSANEKNIDKPDSLKLMELALGQENSVGLMSIIQKIYIADNSPAPGDLYNRIKTQYFKFIPKDNKSTAMQAALGLLISPEIVESGFEITDAFFSEQIQNIASIYNSKTIIFPNRLVNIQLQQEELDQHLDSNFVRKIIEIEYSEVVNEAITDYIITNRTIAEELRSRIVNKDVYDAYEKELLKQIKPKYSKACRSSTTESILRLSKDHYDDIMGMPSPNFGNYNDTHITYKNGTLHYLADDHTHNLNWKLKPENE